jgi:DNA-binding LytR/AlgR family response regulator
VKALHCTIVDDEPLALALLEYYVRQTPFLELASKHSSAEAALAALETNPVDLVIADIQMPGMLGTEFVKRLGGGVMVIFSTAFPAYAIEGFRLDAVDYLLKPFEYASFLKAVTKALELGEMRDTRARREPVRDFLFLRSGFRQVKVDIGKILYIEGEKDYAKIVLEGPSRPVLTLSSLKALEEKLRGWPFIRVHRSWIVHLRRVDSVEKGAIQVGGTSIPITETYREALEKALRDE